MQWGRITMPRRCLPVPIGFISCLLVAHGVRCGIPEQQGSIPLYWASEMGYMRVTRWLVEHDADATAQDKYGWTLLHLVLVIGSHMLAYRFVVRT